MPRTREQILNSVAGSRRNMGINFEINPDEYHPEVGTILPRLRSCQSANDVLRVTHEEFTRWFGADTAGPAGSYRQIASDIWRLCSTRNGSELDSQL